MFPYIAATGFLGVMALLFPSKRVHLSLWLLAFILLLAFIGLRHHVGMDWNNYLIMIHRSSRGTLVEATKYSEPLYAAMLWTSGKLGYGVYGSNLAGALIFTVGLFSYARTTPSPWTALLVAMPYLVIVIAMSANRQTAAIGVLLWAIARWDTSSLDSRISYIVIAAMLHTSAIMFLVFTVSDLHIRRKFKIILSGISMAAIFAYLSSTDKGYYYNQLYGVVQPEYTKSSGALFHVMLNGGPAMLYFMLGRYRRVLLPNDLHRNMALLAVFLMPAVFVASTASSRIGLYLFPVSMYILSALPSVLLRETSRHLYRGILVAFLLGVAFVWLNYANNSRAWLPYRNIMLTPAHEWRLCCT